MSKLDSSPSPDRTLHPLASPHGLSEKLGKLLREQHALEIERLRLWSELTRLRLSMIDGGDDPGPLSSELLLAESDRAVQLRKESLAREHYASDERARAQGLMVRS